MMKVLRKKIESLAALHSVQISIGDGDKTKYTLVHMHLELRRRLLNILSYSKEDLLILLIELKDYYKTNRYIEHPYYSELEEKQNDLNTEMVMSLEVLIKEGVGYE